MAMNNHHQHHIDPSLFQNYTWINNNIINKNHNENNNNNDLIGMAAMEEHTHHHLHDSHHIINPFVTSGWPSSSSYSSFPLSLQLPETRTLLSSPATTLFSDHNNNNNSNNFLDQLGDNQEDQDCHDDQESEDELGPMKEMMYKIAAMQPVDIDPATVRKPKRRNVRISDDPQSVAARHRRERISVKIRILQRLVPGGTKMDTATMLDEAIRYVKFLKRQIRLLQSGSHPPPQPPIAAAAAHGHTWPPPPLNSYKNVPSGGGAPSTSPAGFGGAGGGGLL